MKKFCKTRNKRGKLRKGGAEDPPFKKTQVTMGSLQKNLKG